jgi:hypothetical protein
MIKEGTRVLVKKNTYNCRNFLKQEEYGTYVRPYRAEEGSPIKDGKQFSFHRIKLDNYPQTDDYVNDTVYETSDFKIIKELKPIKSKDSVIQIESLLSWLQN